MGQHTWFYKDKQLREKEIELWEKLDSYERNEIFLNISQIDEIHSKIYKLTLQNKTEYHDLFKVSKRKEDRTYIDDVISTKEECDRWLEENKKFVYWSDEKEERSLLDKFWNEYPNGAIDFS